MSLEQQIAALVTASDALTAEVIGKLTSIDASVAAKLSEVDAYLAGIQTLTAVDPIPGDSLSIGNASYEVHPAATFPPGQRYALMLADLYCRTDNLATSTGTGMSIEVGYCDDSVADGQASNAGPDPSGYTKLADLVSGWNSLDADGRGGGSYNTASGSGWLRPFQANAVLHFAIPDGAYKLVTLVRHFGSSGELVGSQSTGEAVIAQY